MSTLVKKGEGDQRVFNVDKFVFVVAAVLGTSLI